MNFLKKIFTSAPAKSPGSFYTFTVQCDRCGEIIAGHINLDNDLSADYEGGHELYHVRKVLMGSGTCFQRIEIEFDFDSSRKVLDHQASGGRFVENS
jgi:hypothetical protein